MHILEGENVTKFFGGLAAVSDVSFHVERGEVLGLIGPNGAGKTTLFNLISAALVPRPGKITFKGVDITGLPPHKICHMGVARTFQNVKIFRDLRVIDNVRIGALFGRAKSPTNAEAFRQSEELLEFVGLLKIINVPARDLTIGNQKRLEVARALSTKPELLMIDELMSGLNNTEVSQAMDLVKKIQDKGITIVMIEHVMKAIMNICDRIIVLNYGKKIAEGTPQEIANSRVVVEVYLGEDSSAGS